MVAQDPDTDPISYFIRAPGSNQDAEVYKMVSNERARARARAHLGVIMHEQGLSTDDDLMSGDLRALADPAAGLRGANLGRGPNLGYPQNRKLHGFNPLFLDEPRFTFENKIK